ncbi:MAG: hypothetical protein CBC47_00245 [Alphaproteobacteria bacterium TMED87]|nr:MAG: hypothetical protein CBC47_00245 [Alphaproteobacteria bacterium TMED87]
MVGLGIDFGTSNSAVAWCDGKEVVLLELDGSDPIMPTALHLNRDLITTVGQSAVEKYIEENRDRIVELTPEIIAKSSMVTSAAEGSNPVSQAEISSRDVYGQPWVDRGMPGRLFRGVKRLLGNASIRRLLVFDHPFRLVALVTPILVQIREKIEARLGISDSLNVHLGRPVLFEGHGSLSNDLALSRLSEASKYAGIDELSFYPEPVAATLSYLNEKRGLERGCVLTLDFGGGTLDLSVITFNNLTFDVLSTAGLPIGGDHIDQLIFEHLLFPLLGKGEVWRRMVDGRLIENEFPFEEFSDALLNWTITYTLNQNQFRSKVAACIKQGGDAAVKFERLDDLITHNYSYLVFQAIREAKAKLSIVDETVLDIPVLDISVKFTREHLDEIMKEMLIDMESVIDEVIGNANCKPSAIDIVLRTGGSSQIVAVRRLLESRFPNRVVEHDPFSSVAAGLAIASYYGHQLKL